MNTKTASRIVQQALALHGSQSQCDHDLLMRQLDLSLAPADFAVAANAAASDLLDV